MMDAWTTAGVGFGSAIIGAATAFVCALFLSHRAAASRKNGVVRALAGELTQNSTAALVKALGQPELGPEFSTAVWNDGKFEISDLSSNALFALLLGTYSSIWLVEGASAKLQNGDQAAREVIRMWYETVRQALARVLDEFDVPGTKGWRKMDSFDVELAKIQESQMVKTEPMG